VTIRKGQPWGALVAPGPGMRTVDSDRELRDLIAQCRSTGSPLPVFGLLGGDLMRTLGGTADASRFTGDEPIPHLPVDLVSVVTDDDRRTTFVAHLVARRAWWRGPLTAAMNAQFIGRWDVSPRCHPNDGKIDLVTVAAEFGVQQRWLARSRLPLGTHVPHPQITVRQFAETTVELGRRRSIWVDGHRWGTASTLRFVVEPDAIVVCV
jgi:hypothetical protein